LSKQILLSCVLIELDQIRTFLNCLLAAVGMHHSHSDLKILTSNIRNQFQGPWRWSHGRLPIRLSLFNLYGLYAAYANL